jgi:hypothetical protein
MSLKNPVTPPGIDPGTVRLVAPRLNHYATQIKHSWVSKIYRAYLDCLTLEDGTDNFLKTQVQFYAAYNPTTEQISCSNLLR